MNTIINKILPRRNKVRRAEAPLEEEEQDENEDEDNVSQEFLILDH